MTQSGFYHAVGDAVLVHLGVLALDDEVLQVSEKLFALVRR